MRAPPIGAAIRTVRLAGGLVLMAFVACHLANLSLGLVSLEFADHWRPKIMSRWQTRFSDIALYVALGSHLALGLFALGQRRSAASLTGTDRVQLALGIALPLLLALHVAATRGAAALGFQANYAWMLVWYWKLAPVLGLQQVLVVVAAWIHGCLGLYGWLRLRRWWLRVAGVLYPIAFAVPILALLGFVEAGKTALTRYAGDPGFAARIDAQTAKFAGVTPEFLLWETRFRVAYAICLVAALALFATHAWRRRRLRTRIDYVGGPSVEDGRGLSLLEISRGHGVPHASTCSGRARCGTCRVRVLAGAGNLSPIGADEADLLHRLNAGEGGIRLACQAIVTGPHVAIERLVPAELEDEAARRPEAVAAGDLAPASVE